MAETARGELDTWGETKLGMARELRVCFTVMEKVFGGDVTLDGGYKILGSNTVTYQ